MYTLTFPIYLSKPHDSEICDYQVALAACQFLSCVDSIVTSVTKAKSAFTCHIVKISLLAYRVGSSLKILCSRNQWTSLMGSECTNEPQNV